MITFIKDSFREIKHVVWPTKADTNKYLITVVSLLILFGIYLFISGGIFVTALQYAKDIIK